MPNILNLILSTLIFGVIGILLTLLGFKLFDWILPKVNVEVELAERHNIAVAIVMAAVILGISIVVAATIHS
jgi:putative membrane protein